MERDNNIARREFLEKAAKVTAGALGTWALGACDSGPGQESSGSATSSPSTTLETLPPTTTTTTIEKRLEVGLLPPFIRTGPNTRPLVALTVDDIFGAQGVDSLNRTLDIAQDKNFHFTIFPTGDTYNELNRSGRQNVMLRTVQEGHEIGIHTYTHRNLLTLTDAEVIYEMTYPQVLLNQMLGKEYKMRLMRPPGGTGGIESSGPNPHLLELLKPLGLSMVVWSIDAFRTPIGDAYANAIINSKGVGPGSIVLIHFTQLNPDQIGGVVDRLRAKGLEPTTVTGFFT